MRIILKHSILILLIVFQLIIPQIISGQSAFKSESEMKAKAAEYFAADQFNLAFPLYSQLLSLDSKNPDLNYHFGVCLMYTERSNTEEPIAYLEKAINNVTDIDLYYHLAVAYHNNYFFTDAIYNYRKYLQLAKNKARKDYEVDRKIAMCQNGIEMLMAVDDLYVIEKSEVDRKAFYRSYNLMDYGGRILNLPNEFLNKSDLKNQDDKIAYFNSEARLLFYALENKNQKDIYYRIQQNDRQWSDAIILSSVINTEFDEDYPVLMPDGKTLYFSSKGHNTMGGYDIFQSVFDSISNQWSKPINLSFPFNTPSDDILFISDKDETVAWFASDRNSVNDKISVYKVGIIKKEKQTSDLSNIYSKDKLSADDLGKIKNMASLDINISNKAFKEIPVEQQRKLDALLKNDAKRITQNIRQANLINVDRQLAAKEIQTDLTDSIKNVVLRIDSKLESLKALYLQTQYVVTSKSISAQKGYDELSLLLEKVQKATIIDRKKELIAEANKTLFRTLRIDYQYDRLNTIEHHIDNQITAQRELLFQATTIFGDIQKNIVTRNDIETRKNINQLNQLIQKADTLTDYTKIINYPKGDLFNPDYPANLLDELSFAAYYLSNERENATILSIDTRYSAFIPTTDKSAAGSYLSGNETVKPIQQTNSGNSQNSKNVSQSDIKSSISNVSDSNPASREIREGLSEIISRQTEQLDRLKQLSTLLTKKASEKLDASNASLHDFEQMREQYNNGQITDKNSVLAKQTESQNLLYQSLAIISFAEKTDSIFQAEQYRKENSTDKIFAIEQALQNNQIENAQALFGDFETTSKLNVYSEDDLIQDWIAKGVASIPRQKMLANQAFENSQKFTDETLKLKTEAEDLREEAKAKTNAFKRRELTLEAEKKEAFAVQIQENSDKQLAIGNKFYEEIKKAEAAQQIANEFSSSVLYSQIAKPIVNPEKRKEELNERLETREQGIPLTAETNDNLLAQEKSPKLDITKLPKMNDLIAYETKLYKAQLLAEELDINKRETVHFLELEKTLSGSAANKNTEKIRLLRKDADLLQNTSTQTFIEANNIYKELSVADKKLADKNKNDFENYLNNVKNRIAQLLNEVTSLSQQAKTADNEASREDYKRQANEKEQIAMYLLLEGFEIIAQRNHQDYRKNALIIDKIYHEDLNKQEKEFMQPIFSQIESYIQLADNKRIKAKDEDLSFNLQKILLQDALSQESSALDLQQETIRMMREKDHESMLAYQSGKIQDFKPKQNVAKSIVNDEIINALASNSTENQTTSIKSNIAPKEKEEKIPVKTANNLPEKEIVKTEAEKTNINQSPKTFSISNNVNNTSTGFPKVNLGQISGGTQFSVQIAALGDLRTTDQFLNVMELYALKDTEKELYRYFSGKFTTLKEAIIRRNSLRQQGYSDAFIKSWKAGKSVSILEAAGELDENTSSLLGESTISLPSVYRNVNFAATSISQLNGVYYSVQVGVYSRPRSSVQLFNIKPLYHDRLKNGYWVYFNGIFKSIADAEKNKTTIRSKGISDAFIVAFKEGEKISLSNARKALSQGDSPPANEDIIILDEAANNIDNQLNAIVGQTKTSSKNSIYKIQIGVFSHAVSFDWVSDRLSNTGNNEVEFYINSSGKYIYTVGSFKSYAEAATFNNENVKEMIKDSFIVTFENGKN